jgi:hypothetical protein
MWNRRIPAGVEDPLYKIPKRLCLRRANALPARFCPRNPYGVCFLTERGEGLHATIKKQPAAGCGS